MTQMPVAGVVERCAVVVNGYACNVYQWCRGWTDSGPRPAGCDADAKTGERESYRRAYRPWEFEPSIVEEDMTPSLCRLVVVVGAVATSNGADHAPGLVTRVWSDDMVNLIVFPDAADPRPATSVKVYPDEAAARDAVKRIREQTGSDDAGVAAYWPPRV